jgi:ATP-binding cassette, subfamily B (MDR/TAP), member 1
MIVGTLCACAMGTAVPFLTVLWGNVTDNFANTSETVAATKNVMLNLFGIGGGTILAGWGMFGCWIVTAERQGIACRQNYLRSLLRQEIGWFDTINQSELASNFAADSFAFHGAIGEKVSSLIMTISTFASGLIIAYINGWLMALVITASLPAVAFGGYLYSSAISKKDSELEN